MLVEQLLPAFMPLWALPLVLFLIYSVVLVIYRLYFHPLARFPGPRIAAATFWYEFYHDAVRRGKYTWEIKAMHEKYGPIIRINPHELHINDPDYYDYLFNLKLDKWEWFTRQFGNETSTQSTPRHDVHRMRRGAIAPYFTRAKVIHLESVVRDKVEALCARLSGFRKVNCDSRHSGGELEPTCLGIAYHCLTTEVVTKYSWGRAYDCIDDPDFKADWFFMLRGLAEVGHISRQFGWFLPLMESLPVWLAGMINKNAKDSAEFRRGLVDQVTEIKKTPKEQFAGKSHPTIFHEIHNSSLPDYETTSSRLSHEGLLVLFAGFETTANTMAVTTYHLLRNPDKLAKVRAELEGVMRGREGDIAKWVELEKLEYFTAVITEGLRMASGVSSRLPRVAPPQGLKFRNWDIPAGTPVSMNPYLVLTNPTIFPNPDDFVPERWLGPTASSLQRYFVPFSKGPRACLGIHLAYAELYVTLATVLWRFPGLKLYETNREDIDVVHDFFLPYPKLDSKGLRVTVE